MDTKKLRQKILDLAIHGKLVPQDPNDEPASVLLERIKAEKERLIKEGKIKRSKKSAKTSDTPHYENVPFDVPEGWVWTTLEEICLFLSRGKSPKYSDTDKTYPVFAQKCNLKEGGISLEQARFLEPSTICKWSEEYRLKTGDVLVNSTGTGTVGRTRLFHEGYLKNYPFVVPDSHVSVIRTTNEVKSEFVFAYISSQLIQQYLEDNLAGSTNQKELYIGVLSDLSFPLPPLAEQHRIVAEIERWFSLIDQIEQCKTDLHTAIKQTKSKILDLAIHGKLVPQDPNDEPAIELLKRINPDFTPCDNGHYTQLPEGWSICKLSKLCKIENGFAFSSNDYKSEGTPLIRISNIVNNSIDLTDCVYIQNNAEYRFVVNKGDLLIAMSGATTGKMGVYSFERTAFLNQRVSNIKILDGSLLSADYRNVYMQSKVDDILKFAYGGAQPNISASVIGDFDILLPPLEEQNRIVCTVNKVFTKLDTIMESL